MVKLSELDPNKAYIIRFQNDLTKFAKSGGIKVTFSSKFDSGNDVRYNFTTVQLGYYNILADESQYGHQWELDEIAPRVDDEDWSLELGEEGVPPGN